MGQKLIAIIAIFLFQITAPSSILSSEFSALNPETKLPDSLFKEKFGIIQQAIYIYKLDVQMRGKKDEIRKEYEANIFGMQSVRFDLENMDIGRKGWTRYYQFLVGQKRYTIRIFLTAEKLYQPALEPDLLIQEGSIKSPPVTFQIMPDINDVLSKTDIKPHRINPSSISIAGKSL